jgi:hypothetical protein
LGNPQVEDILANHENRLINLEGLFPTLSREDCKEIVREVIAETLTAPEEWTKKQWDVVNQLRAEVKHIHREVHETKSKKPKKYKEYVG